MRLIAGVEKSVAQHKGLSCCVGSDSNHVHHLSVGMSISVSRSYGCPITVAMETIKEGKWSDPRVLDAGK